MTSNPWRRNIASCFGLRIMREKVESALFPRNWLGTSTCAAWSSDGTHGVDIVNSHDAIGLILRDSRAVNNRGIP